MKFLNHNLFTGDITVNGTTTLSTATGVTRATGDNSTHLATTAFVKAQGYATTAALAGYVPTTRTLTINGTTYDLSANRSWTITSADGYISNVQVVGSTLSFTGVGSAFSGVVDLSTLTPTVRTVFETVKNVSGATILKGTPLAVVAGQTSGNISDVVPADAADPTKMPAVFIANENIADQAEGEAVLFGNLTGVDTSLYQSGTTVYVAPGGGWTATKPVWPNLIQNLGVITKQHATNGGGVVTGVGRANALPNLTAGKIWVGSANYPIESTTVHVDEANARVGIGTTNPSAKLDVNGAQIIQSSSGFGTDADQAALYISNTNNYGISGNFNGYSRNLIKSNGVGTLTVGRTNTSLIGELTLQSGSSGIVTVYAGGSERLRITSTGNVGIGTTSPSVIFHVKGPSSTGWAIFERGTKQLYINANYSGLDGFAQVAPSNASAMDMSIAATDSRPSDIYIKNATGNVGIGTTNPTNKLQVANGNMSITSGYSFILADTDTNWRLGRNIIVESGNYLTASTFQLVAANAANEGWQFVNDDGFTVLEIGALTAARHVWVNAGNLSVGVASPQEKIHVAGNVRIDGGSTAAILETNNATAAEAGTTYRAFTTADHYAVFVDYVIYDAGRTNMRTGTFRAVWTTGDVVYTDVSTVDLGATDNVVLSAAISGANVNLIVTGPTDYTLKYNLKVIK